MKKLVLYIFLTLVFVSLLTPLWVFKELMFPYITSKAFFFRILIEAGLPLYIYLLLSGKNLRPNLKNPLNIAVLLFFVISLVASLLGVNVSRSLWGNYERMGGTYYLAHLTLLYFYVQIIGQAGEQYLKRFLQAFVGVATLVTLNGLMGWIGGPTVVLDPSLPDRVSSTFGNPIFFASYLVIPMFLAAYFAAEEEIPWKKYGYWALVLLQFLGIYSSGTRGAVVGLILGLFVGAVVYLVTTTNAKAKKYGLSFILVIVLALGLLYGIRSKLPAGSTLRRIVNLRDSNTEARLIQWKMALEGAKKYFITGTGPENYYVVSNEYYNTDLYKYDPSWFDKPHNFVLEVLVTTGIFGLLLYISIFAFSLYGLWRAFKAGILSAWSVSLFIAALITYQVQNLFVFDTVSASTSFYLFTGLIAYLWTQSNEDQPAKQLTVEQAWMKAVFAVSIVAVVYGGFISNAVSMMASKRANFGFAYAQANPKRAANYFETALTLGTNLDKRELATRYSTFASSLASSGAADTQPDFAKEQITKATQNLRTITEKVNNDPLLWLSLANSELFYDIIHGQAVDSDAELAIKKGMELAPKRIEVWQFMVQLYEYQQNFEQAITAAKQVVSLNPYRPDVKWQLAMAYYLGGKMPEAIAVGNQALNEGYEFQRLREFAWFVEYHEAEKDYKRVAALLEKAVVLEPGEIGLYVDLANVYITIGEKDKAINLAEQIMTMDPGQTAAMQKLIQSLK